MKYLCVFCFLIFCSLSFSCDPGYYVAINNRSNYEKEVQIYSLRADSFRLFTNVENNEFDYGELVKKTPTQSRMTVSPGQYLIIESYIGGPSRDSYIIVDDDTIYAYNFPVKKYNMLSRKYVYSIAE
jgi:hypothetical protein